MRIAPIFMFGSMGLFALPFLFFVTFNGVKSFDDEGTLMITFREIMEGHFFTAICRRCTVLSIIFPLHRYSVFSRFHYLTMLCD